MILPVGQDYAKSVSYKPMVVSLLETAPNNLNYQGILAKVLIPPAHCLVETTDSFFLSS